MNPPFQHSELHRHAQVRPARSIVLPLKDWLASCLWFVLAGLLLMQVCPAQPPAGHPSNYRFSPRSFAPGQTIVISGQGTFNPEALPTVEFSGVPSTSVRLTPDGTQLFVVVPGGITSGPLRLVFNDLVQVFLGNFTLIEGRIYIPCAGSPPTYTVEWSPTQPPAELTVGTLATVKNVNFINGKYTPGHWAGETVTEMEWRWHNTGFKTDAIKVGSDGTKVWAYIRGSYASDICTPALGETVVNDQIEGIFNAKGKGGDTDGVGGLLPETIHIYDPGDSKPPTDKPFIIPDFPWNPHVFFPDDQSDPDGEIHGEVTLDAPDDSYQLLNYVRHSRRNSIPTLCQGSIIVAPAVVGTPTPEVKINLGLSVWTIDCTTNPVQANLSVTPTDMAIADAEYDFYAEHGSAPRKKIASWPYTAPRDPWVNPNNGREVKFCGHLGTRLIAIPKTHTPPRLPRPVSLALKYQPIKPASSKISARAIRVTEVNLLPFEVVDLSPKVKDEDNNDIAGSEKPNRGKPLTPFVETDPNVNKIAHREIKVKFPDALKSKKVTWTLEALPGATPAAIRGQWEDSPTHKNRFEPSSAYDPSSFKEISQSSSETMIGADGHTAIRVNVPPIGFNQVRIKIQIEGMSTPDNLIDMEVPGVVVIDPGHGGAKSGPILFGSSWNNATSPSGVLEKTMALNCGLAVRAALINKRKEDKLNLRIFMTRDTDVGVRGDDRAFKARDNGADVIFIIHFNSLDDGPNAHRARGTLEVVRDSNNVHPEQDTVLSNTIISRMVNAMDAYDTGANHRGPVIGNTAVASDAYNGNTANYHPVRTCYCEVEFIDFGANTADKTDDLVDILLNSGSNAGAVKTAVAKAISDGILHNLRDQPLQ